MSYQEQQDELEVVKAKIRSFRDFLVSINVSSVTVEYSGSGDSGDIDDVNIDHSNGGSLTELTGSQRATLDEIEDPDLWYSLIPDDGWENNDGGGGTLVYKVAEDRFFVNSYYYESVRLDNPQQEL